MSLSKVSRMRPSNSGEQFTQLEATRKQKPPRAEEFIALVDLWQRKSPPAGEGGVTAAAVEDEAADPVEQARREAEKIVEAAKAEAARLREEAQRQGRAEGERQGRAAAEKEYAQRLGSLNKILKNLEEQRGAIVRRYREELLLLATTMTDRLVHHEISVNPAVIESCFRGAMEYVIENSLVKAHLNPDDFHRLKEAGLADPTLFGGKNRVQLVEDPAVAAGGCLLKSSFGEIDATLESCRDKLYQAVDRAFQAALIQEGAAVEEPLEPGETAGEGQGPDPVGS